MFDDKFPNSVNDVVVEDMIITAGEYKVLRKYKTNLEPRFEVQINLPVVDVRECCSSDVFCANISGKGENINYIKNFLKRKMKEHAQKRQERCTMVNSIPTITLSDSDSDTHPSILVETQNKTEKKKKKRKGPAAESAEEVIDLTSSIIKEEENICEVSSSTNELETQRKVTKTDSSLTVECTSLQKVQQESALNYIPLNSNKKGASKEKKTRKRDNDPEGDDSVVVLSDDEVPRPVSKSRRVLRPIVIDGSNIAREHGKATKTFSSKGIKISIDYFLNRGHTQVTAFVPMFRRHCKYGGVPTTDESILEDYAVKQHVVFTPSRRVNGKVLACYDDRFIVELASKTGGVILSNDNYKDLINDSEEFRKTIEERLLMYCFVGDMLMIPNDPLGRLGPNLDEFLSMPEKCQESPPTNSVSVNPQLQAKAQNTVNIKDSSSR